MTSPDERRSTWRGCRDLVLALLFILACGIAAGIMIGIAAALFAR